MSESVIEYILATINLRRLSAENAGERGRISEYRTQKNLKLEELENLLPGCGSKRKISDEGEDSAFCVKVQLGKDSHCYIKTHTVNSYSYINDIEQGMEIVKSMTLDSLLALTQSKPKRKRSKKTSNSDEAGPLELLKQSIYDYFIPHIRSSKEKLFIDMTPPKSNYMECDDERVVTLCSEIIAIEAIMDDMRSNIKLSQENTKSILASVKTQAFDYIQSTTTKTVQIELRLEKNIKKYRIMIAPKIVHPKNHLTMSQLKEFIDQTLDRLDVDDSLLINQFSKEFETFLTKRFAHTLTNFVNEMTFEPLY